MSPKIGANHVARAAIVYVRQSTMAQVVGNLESQRRQYDLAGAARTAGFKSRDAARFSNAANSALTRRRNPSTSL